ncbi:MAG: hypothetical protein ACK4FF_02135 [Limnobacter sp.]|uniref:hypothetical protein n=1 Tax=Limnobacter sp. TaxID=2003368 RepID=UPI003918F047
MSILDQAIAAHPFYPKAIKVGSQLWKDLAAAGRIKWKRGYIEGVIDSKVDFPTLDERIFLHVSPELDDLSYELPQNS